MEIMIFIFGMLFGVLTTLLCFRAAKVQEQKWEAEAEEEVQEDALSQQEIDAYRKYEDDMIRQMRNMMRYDGTEEGQEDKEYRA